MDRTNDMLSESENWQIAFYNATLTDIENTKRRQFETTYYSTLVSAGIFVVIYTFDHEKTPVDYWFYDAAILIALVHGLVSVLFQFALIRALAKFRSRLESIYAKGARRRFRAAVKFMRDMPFFLYFLYFPVAATAIVIYYIVRVHHSAG